MLPIGEPVPENGRTDEEEGTMEIDGQNGNQESDETEEVKTEEEEHRQNAGSENNVNQQNDSGNQESQDGENDEIQEENPSGLVLVKVEEVDEEEEEDNKEERRRRAAEKGKQPMPDQGGITITELNDEDDTDYHLDLAILRTILDYKCSTRNSPHPPSYNNQLLFIKNSFPDLKISIEDLEEKITALVKRFNDVRKQHGDV